MKTKKLFTWLTALMVSVSSVAQTSDVFLCIDGLRYMLRTGISDYAIFIGVEEGQRVTNLVIPPSIKYDGRELQVYRIERDAMRGNTDVKTIHLPECIRQISDDAFNGCKNLEYFNIPRGVTLVGSHIAEETAWMDRQSEGPVVNDGVVLSWKGASPADGELWIEDGIRLIAKRAFNNKAQIHTLHIPASVKGIGDDAFWNCGLREVYLSTPVVEGWLRRLPIKKVVLCEGVREVTPQAFGLCSMLEDIEFPKSIEYLSSTAFCQTEWYMNLRRESDDIIYINDIAFTYGMKVRVGDTLKLREGTRAIAGNAFSYCNNIASIEIPEGVEVIGKRAFWGSNLNSIKLPSTIKDIQEDALASNKIPNVISCNPNPTDLSAEAFSDDFVKNAVLTVPENTTGLYRLREGWGKFKNIKELDVQTGASEIKGKQMSSSECFDLMGRRLAAPPAKGMYIENGGKIMK